RRARDLHLADENFLLHVWLGVFVEVVESDLADGDDFLRSDQALDLGVAGSVRKLRFVRMYTAGSVDIFVGELLGELRGAIERAGAGPVADAQDGFDTGGAS